MQSEPPADKSRYDLVMASRLVRTLLYSLLATTVAIVSFIGYLAYRILNPDLQEMTGSNVRLILDSGEVQSLIAKESFFAAREKVEVDRYFRTPAAEREPVEKYIPERIAFLNAMEQVVSVPVPANAYCRVLKQSNTICSRYPDQNPTYIKVRITRGPAKGQEGWGCEGDGLFRVVAWP
jgi:hypothetical protein